MLIQLCNETALLESVESSREPLLQVKTKTEESEEKVGMSVKLVKRPLRKLDIWPDLGMAIHVGYWVWLYSYVHTELEQVSKIYGTLDSPKIPNR